MKPKALSLLACALLVQSTQAAPFTPPPAFLGGPPGRAQFQAIQMQRHQARTLLYREALEELRKNPHAADVPECPSGGAVAGALCLVVPIVVPVPPPPVIETPIRPDPVVTPVPPAKPTGRKLAVLFGINAYQEPIPELSTPIADVEGIAEVLRSRYGYQTRVLKDVGKAGIIEALNAVAKEVVPEDSVLLFYAGHGYLLDDNNMGYWIPIDASVRTPVNWISNKDISKLLSAISARQLILVSDSCFSGSLTKEQKVSGRVSSRENILMRRSVMAFSSGGEEPVADAGKEGHSIFAWSFINTLQSSKGIAPGYEIYRVVHGQVMKDFPQEPQYGAVISAGHAVGGEYIFDAANP